MKKMFKISAAAFALLSASAAFAQTSAPDMKSITRAEVLARVAARFDAADTNKDGVLSRDEKHQAREQKMHDKHMRHPGMRRGPPPPGGPDDARARHGEHGGPRGQGATPPPPVGEQR